MRTPLLLVLSAACAAPSASTDDTDETGAVDTDPPGSCAPLAPPAPDLDVVAGVRSVDLTYALPWSGEDRTVLLHTWYPTAATTGEPAVWLGLQTDPHSLVDAPVDLPEGDCKLPLLVYSHGSQGWAGGGSDLVRQFVRQGWIAVGPDHTGNTLTDNAVPQPPVFPLTRLRDVQAAIDAIEALPSSDPLAGRIDTSRVLVVGHSYGGQTAWLASGPVLDASAADARCGGTPACTTEERAAFDASLADPRIVGVVPMAGAADEGLVASASWDDVDVPVLYLTGTEDHDGTPQFTRAGGADVRWVEVEGGCHETFTSTAVPCGTLAKAEGLTLVATYVQAFAAQVVLGSEDAGVAGVLDGSVEVSAAATLHLSERAGAR